jgi:hypothetical protein
MEVEEERQASAQERVLLGVIQTTPQPPGQPTQTAVRVMLGATVQQVGPQGCAPVLAQVEATPPQQRLLVLQQQTALLVMPVDTVRQGQL